LPSSTPEGGKREALEILKGEEGAALLMCVEKGVSRHSGSSEEEQRV